MTVWNLIALVGFIVSVMSAIHTAQATHVGMVGYALAGCVGLVVGIACGYLIFWIAKRVRSRVAEDSSLASKLLIIALYPISIGCIVLADYCGGWMTVPFLRLIS